MEVASHNFESDSGEQASTNDDVESSQRWTTDFDDDSDTEEEDNEASISGKRMDANGAVVVGPCHYRHRPPPRRRHTGNGYRRNGDDDNDDEEDENTDQSDSNGYVDYDDSDDEEEEDDGNGKVKRRALDLNGGTSSGRHALLRGASVTAGVAASLPKKGGVSNGRSAITAKQAPQSDTETRNLLDDVGDFDDDCLDLEETFVGLPADAPTAGENHLFDLALFELSDEQYDYYANCFMYLLATTQGHVQIDGALNGADARIIHFFHKSRLDNGSLSRIWSLADVNEDGFLNLAEFVVAMHVIVLHLKMGLAIPTTLPRSVRPPITPVRQLIRLTDGNLASLPTSVALRPPAEDGSTTTTSAASSSNSNTSNFTISAVNGSSDGDSNGRRQPVPPLHQFTSAATGHNTMSTSLELTSRAQNGGYEIIIDSHVSAHSNTQISDNAFVDRYTGFADAAVGYSSASGVKQHSLSDDHLNLYAQQRDVRMTNFSDVPPVLVDSHPTALNALYTPLVLLGNPSSHRGPPPQPPPRDYAAGGGSGKGHGRSASLDLKTFPALSPSYATKHAFVTKNSAENEDAAYRKLFPQQHLETLSEDLANPASRQLSGFTYALRERSTQTEYFAVLKLPKVDALTSEYEDVFSTSDLYENLSTEARCDLLKRLNGELEVERLKLTQIRLQLQLRIEEAESELKTYAPTVSGPKRTKIAADNDIKTASKSTAL